MKQIVTLVMLSLAVPGAASANRIVEQTEGAYEVPLADAVLPSGPAGRVLFTPCADCERLSLRVGASTVYLVGAEPVSLAEFREAAERFAGRGGVLATALYVYYDVDSERVNRLVLDHFAD